MTDLPDPLVPADVDLQDQTYMPLKLASLFGSEFWAKANDKVFRAGLSLWAKSWHQVPASSMPDNNVVLAKAAGLSLDDWAVVRDDALHGFVKCSDGRLYHPVVADLALIAWTAKLRTRRDNGQAAHRMRIWRAKQREDLQAAKNKGKALRVTSDDYAVTDQGGAPALILPPTMPKPLSGNEMGYANGLHNADAGTAQGSDPGLSVRTHASPSNHSSKVTAANTRARGPARILTDDNLREQSLGIEGSGGKGVAPQLTFVLPPLPAAKPKASKRVKADAVDDFALTPDMRVWIARHTPNIEPDKAIAEFKDYVRSKQPKFKDLEAAFRNSCRRLQERHEQRFGHALPPHRANVSPGRAAYRQAFKEWKAGGCIGPEPDPSTFEHLDRKR